MDEEGQPQLISSEDPATAAARVLFEALVSADRKRGHARLAIPGGSALTVFERARALSAEEAGLWRRLRLTWVDERCVPFESSDSNRGTAYRSGALSTDRPPQVELPLWVDGETVEGAVSRVRQGLARDFDDGFDVLLLGMGPDGHVASIFPDDEPTGPDLVAFVPNSPKPPCRRMTLTREALRRSSASVLMATGEAKRRALVALLDGDPSLPAHGLKQLTIVTDLDLEGDQ